MIAYFDCFSGISGDMIVGALLDAGVPFDWLREEIGKLPLTGYKLEATDVTRGRIGGKGFKVLIEGGQVDRDLTDIKEIISGSALTKDAKDLSIRIFERLAEAEASIHRVGIDDVHFHEVGGVDSIIDIVAASLSLSYLGINEVYASGLPLSQGVVSCEHGLLPLPAPATMELLKGAPVYLSLTKGEMVTPTGAAFIAATCKGFGVMPEMKLQLVGYGAGERENEGVPNLLRVMIGENHRGQGSGGSQRLETDSVTVVEANIDDMNPEIYGFVMDRLFNEGALDVSLAPVYMKKGRPGTLLQVICEIGREEEMIDLLLKETSTIGVRYHRAQRFKLPRKSVEVRTRFGNIRLKVAETPWGDRARPEYEDCRKAASDIGAPIQEVYAEAMEGFRIGRDSK